MGSAIHKLVFQPPNHRQSHSPPKTLIELRTALREKIVAYHIDYGFDLTVLFSHGNAEDVLSLISYFQTVFCPKLQVNAFLYEYTGYRPSTGTPSEAAVYADIEAAFHYMVNVLGLKPQNIILYGRSLGTGPSCYLAHKYDKQFLFRGLILQSPFLSCFRVAVPSPITLPGDMFANIDRVEKIRTAIMIVHGVRDKLVPFEHGRALFARCNSAVDCLWLSDAAHNDIEESCGNRLFDRYARFIHRLTEEYRPPGLSSSFKGTTSL